MDTPNGTDVYAAVVTPVPEDEGNRYYGKDCPVHMVQVEFVGVAPALRQSAYGYKPSESAFLEVYVGGQRFCIDVVAGRGLEIIGPVGMRVDHHSLNAVSLLLREASA